jgi:hypothetical protein
VSFEYDKVAGKEGEHSSWWTSYADLFMMLSIVFLLMYVASALRSGSAGFQQQAEFKKLAQKAQGLEQQIKVYNTLKDEALQKESSEAEQEAYQKLMSKLTLLQDEARDEKNSLRQKAKENEEKEQALNQYQALVKGIINANILAKKQIVHRDEVIVTKDATIEEKKRKITEMERTIERDEQQIEDINTRLADRIEALRTEQSRSRSSKLAMEQQITALRDETENKIKALEIKKRMVSQELTQVRSTLQDTEVKLDQAHGTIRQKDQTIQVRNQTIEAQEREKSQLAEKLSADRARYAAELEQAEQEHAAKLAAERSAFMSNLKKQRMSAEARARKIAQFAAQAEKKAGALENQLSGLHEKISQTDSKLKSAEAEYAAAQARLAGTQKELQGTKSVLAGTQQALQGTKKDLEGTKQALSGTKSALEGTKAALGKAEADKGRALAAVEDLQGDLARTRAMANARKILAAQIVGEFNKAGIKGAVDGKTGEVTLDFGGEYFDTGSTNLKPNMRTTLDKFIPLYARSLFSNPKLADKIANVEIVGFASSTFKGKYVKPNSIRPGDKEAIEYNLNLSFGRANSIFKHMLNHGNMSEKERERLLPLMKVVGRGYLPDNVSASDIPDGMPEKVFCAKYNCKKAQRVIVKFNMKD